MTFFFSSSLFAFDVNILIIFNGKKFMKGIVLYFNIAVKQKNTFLKETIFGLISFLTIDTLHLLDSESNFF